MSIIKESVTSQYPIGVLVYQFTGSETVYSEVVDTSKYEDGVYFAISAIMDPLANVTFTFQHSHTTTPGDFANVTADNVIYGRDGITGITYRILNNSATITRNLQGLPCIREGFRNTRRYLRVAAIGLLAADSYVTVCVIPDSELLPTPKSRTYYFTP